MNDTATLYDKTIRKLKNNKVIVLILVAFAVLLGLAQLRGALAELLPSNTRMRVDAFVQPYDFMVGNIESPKSLMPVEGNMTDVHQVADKLAEELVSAIGSTSGQTEAVLRIEGSNLRASQPLRAVVVVHARRAPGEKLGRITHELSNKDLDLQPIFDDPHFTGPDGHSIDMEIVPAAGTFQREPLKIYKRPGGFSLDADAQLKQKTLTFSQRTTKIILARFDAKGEDLERASIELDSTLRTALQKYPPLEVSPLTLEELEKQRKDVENVGAGPAQSGLADQFDVHYIITGTVLPAD